MSVSLNTRQKVFIVIFMVAAAGLVCDRTFLSPSQAEAAKTPNTLVLTDSLLKNLGSDPQQDNPDRQFNDQLQALSQQQTSEPNKVRDAFALSPAWNDSLHAPGSSSLSPAAAAFKKKYQLKAVVSLGTQGRAFVNDRMISIGDVLDGFTLTRVEDEAAVFEQNGESLTLSLTKTP